jgi:hypothetical protein
MTQTRTWTPTSHRQAATDPCTLRAPSMRGWCASAEPTHQACASVAPAMRWCMARHDMTLVTTPRQARAAKVHQAVLGKGTRMQKGKCSAAAGSGKHTHQAQCGLLIVAQARCVGGSKPTTQCVAHNVTMHASSNRVTAHVWRTLSAQATARLHLARTCQGRSARRPGHYEHGLPNTPRACPRCWSGGRQMRCGSMDTCACSGPPWQRAGCQVCRDGCSGKGVRGLRNASQGTG